MSRIEPQPTPRKACRLLAVQVRRRGADSPGARGCATPRSGTRMTGSSPHSAGSPRRSPCGVPPPGDRPSSTSANWPRSPAIDLPAHTSPARGVGIRIESPPVVAGGRRRPRRRSLRGPGGAAVATKWRRSGCASSAKPFQPDRPDEDAESGYRRDRNPPRRGDAAGSRTALMRTPPSRTPARTTWWLRSWRTTPQPRAGPRLDRAAEPHNNDLTAVLCPP